MAFTVWDTGIGIPVDKQHLIFQKFQQLENPLTRRFEGTGLGLVLTQRLARLHGGDVTFISIEGEGSEFTLLLPPHPPDWKQDEEGLLSLTQFNVLNSATHSKPLLDSITSQQNRLVLIVEGVPRFIEALSSQLVELGYRVVIARSGTEALEKARRLQPCIIFLNPILPLLSGWDVLTLLKSNPATHHIPVVITATRAEREQAIRDRADEFLSLPIQSQLLQQVLQRLLPQASGSKSRSKSPQGLTVLVLNADQNLLENLSELLQHHQHKVLEVVDLEQAELLARVWKPHVMVMNQIIPDPLNYLQQLSQSSFLSDLPLITLTPENTQAANQLAALSVFPCLIAPDGQTVDASSVELEVPALLQVIQVAAGINWQPCVLIVDVAGLVNPTDGTLSSTTSLNFIQKTHWLQTLLNSLQAADLRGLMSSAWIEVLQKVQCQSVDLLLIYWHDRQDGLEQHQTAKSLSDIVTTLNTIKQIAPDLPILVLDQRQLDQDKTFFQQGIPDSQEAEMLLRSSTPAQEDGSSLWSIATQILSASLSTPDVLEQIKQALIRTGKLN